jgi:tRNA G10  N-methylase Trm11
MIKPRDGHSPGLGDRRASGSDARQRHTPAARYGGTTMFATAIPGLAPLVQRAVADIPGTTMQDSGFDGRSDVIRFDVAPSSRADVLSVGVTEDVFVEVGRTLRAKGDAPGRIAGQIWQPVQVERALSVWAEQVKPLKRSMTFRVIARVLQERSFKRTDLRRELTDTIGRDRRKWRTGDPAELEVWISEYTPGRFVAGLRLSDARMRHRGGRVLERPGALRPTVANAMVYLAGVPGEPRGTLLDPCCGSGTILGEALAAGWQAQGFDLDPGAVAIARQNVPDAQLDTGDVQKLDLTDASVAACVSNLPFGQQYSVHGDTRDWLRSALAEMARVTRPASRIVLLVPELQRTVLPEQLRLRDRFPIRLLGTKTTIWVHDRIES